MIVWAGFASKIIQERCFIDGLQAWPHKGIAPPTLIQARSWDFVQEGANLVRAQGTP